MKDKRAAVLKKRRREERERTQEQNKDAFMQSFNNHLEKSGIKKRYNRDIVWNAQKRLRKDIQKQSYISCIYTTMYCMNRLYGWSRDRLIRFCNEILWISDAVTKGDRTLEQLENELVYETAIDIKLLFKERAGCNSEKASRARMSTDVILAEMPCIMIVCLYVLYNYNGFRHKRIKRVAETVRAEVEDVLLNGRLPEIQEHLRKCRIDTNLDGKIRAIERDGDLKRDLRKGAGEESGKK